VKFEARTKELVATFPNLAALVEPLLIVRRALREQIVILHLAANAREDEMCRHMARSTRNAFYVWPAVAATECPWRLLPRCRNGTTTNAKAVKAADERMSRVRLS
jgi:transposase